MSVPKTTKVIVNANPPIGEIKPDTFSVITRDVPELKDGQVLLRSLAFGNEPAQRGWIDGEMDPKRMYRPMIIKDQAMDAPGIGEVIESRSDKWKKGVRVKGMLTWSEYQVVDAARLQPVPAIPGQSEWVGLGALGLTGLTAWVGLFDIAQLKPEHTILVSGAAGAVGNAVVQIAKHVVGCKRVVGIAGGKEKCDWVKSLGADECVDYKSKSFSKDLKASLPDDAEVFFDNIGGQILNEALTVVKKKGIIAVCGSISGYNGDVVNLSNYFNIIAQTLTVKGFLVMDSKNLGQANKELTEWVKDGKLKVVDGETVVDTKFEDVMKTWQMLFTGGNRGKLVTKLVWSEEGSKL